LAICEQRSDKVEAARVLSNWAAVETRAGDSEAALDYAQRAEQLARESGDQPVLRVALANLSRSQVVSRDLEAALVAAKESVEVATELGEPFGLRQSLNVLVEAHRARGEVDTALVTLREALRIDQPSKAADLESLANMVALLSLSGHPQEALRLAGAVQANSQQLGIGSAPDPSLYKALDEAIEVLGPRAASIRESGRQMSIEEARAFALREPGSEPVPGVRLTRREVEVARLVRAGMTDAQIAKNLFLSVRTAETHVENVRNKLGVRTRAEVAAWAAMNLP